MNDTTVTVVGNVATAPTFHAMRGGTGGTVAVSRFRIAATARRWHREEQRWVDGHTNFYTVAAWRHLADNVASSVTVGDPVVVHGRLRLRDEEYNGQRRLSAEIDAISIGHDLARGTSAFRRPPREDARSGAAATAVARDRSYGSPAWGPAAGRTPVRVGDVVDEMFLRTASATGEEGVAASPGGALGGEGEDGQKAKTQIRPQIHPQVQADIQPPAQARIRAEVQPPAQVRRPAAKRAVPRITTPHAPEDDPSALSAPSDARAALGSALSTASAPPAGPASPSNRVRSKGAALVEPGSASTVPGPTAAESTPDSGEPTTASAPVPAQAPARARRTVAKRRARGAEEKPAPTAESDMEARTARVRGAVLVGASLGDPDAEPPF
jgi:single-stranded DNA-binding protein